MRGFDDDRTLSVGTMRFQRQGIRKSRQPAELHTPRHPHKEKGGIKQNQWGIAGFSRGSGRPRNSFAK